MVTEPNKIPVIIQDDNPTLRKISEPVTVFDEQLKMLVAGMVMAMRANNGRGLSAVQIGVLKRVVIAAADDRFYAMVNPVITRSLKREVVEREGCLSINRGLFHREVSRPAKCDITWQSVSGTTYSESFSGESARVLQHEIDHLDGILIKDKPRL